MEDNIQGFIIIGPKSKFKNSTCIAVYYIPTQEQINNLQKLFGWDFITYEEYKELI